MAPSTRRTPYLSTKPTPPPPLGPTSTSGVKKSRKWSSSRGYRNNSNIKAKRPRTTGPAHRSSIEDITVLMERITITAPANKPTTPANELPAPKTKDPAPPSNAPSPPANLQAPPTTLEGLQGPAPEPSRQGRIALNCRYRVPNTYLTVYHRHGRVMLCRPWEEPWLNSGNKGCGWL